jgi:hypothetical protein
MIEDGVPVDPRRRQRYVPPTLSAYDDQGAAVAFLLESGRMLARMRGQLRCYFFISTWEGPRE